MCAYFFKVSLDHAVNDQKPNEERQSFKNDSQESKYLYTFDRTKSEDIDLIKYCTLTAQQKLLDCQAADKEAATLLAIGLITFSTGFIPFSWVIAPLALVYSGYLMKERSSAYDEYTAALEDLHRCADWALNHESTTQDDMNNDTIKSMLSLLKQVMTTEQLKAIIVDGDIENEFISSIKNNEVNDEDKKKTLTYMIYGYNQGGSLSDVALKIKDYIQYVCNQLVHTAVEAYITTWAPEL